MSSTEMVRVPGARVRQRLQSHYGPWAVVTGASDGIGRAFAEQLAAGGVSAVLVARRAAVLERLAAQLRRLDVAVRVVPADLSDVDAVRAVDEATRDLDVGLVVAAAGFGTSGPMLGNALDVELNLVDVNCRAVAALAHVFGARLQRRGRGGLVLLSSLVAFQGVPRAANYAATKAYVQTLAEGLRVELGPAGVDVVACAPGPVSSGFAARADMDLGNAASPMLVAEQTLARLGRSATVRPGWLAKFLMGTLALLPRAGKVWVMTRVMRGMTTHQGAA